MSTTITCHNDPCKTDRQRETDRQSDRQTDIHTETAVAVLHRAGGLSPSGGDLAPSLGGRNNFSRTKISEWRFFLKKFPFSRPKFLITFFSHWPGFSDFPILSFSRFSVSLTIFNVVYDLFLTKTTTISEKNSFMTPLFYSVRTFARIRQH